MTTDNSPSQTLAGTSVQGTKRKTPWNVLELLKRPIGGTGGTFSVGYLVEDNDGKKAFMKATDLGLLGVSKAKSKLDQITDAMVQQQFERSMLEVCQGSGMDRIVHSFDYGEHEVVVEGIKEYVFFIIFEIAKGNIRQKAREFRSSGISWIPKAAHNLSVALSQLHKAKISHNDVKPSNFLVFDITLQKLSDLGRATSDGVAGPWDSLKAAGDRTYSPPEAWGYQFDPQRSGSRYHHDYRANFDLYMLGSLIYFLLTEQSLNQTIMLYLRPEYLHVNWTGTFCDVLPYIRDAHGCALQHMKKEVIAIYGDDATHHLEEIFGMVRNLTEVDPEVRGDAQNSTRGLSRLDLQRVISRCNSLSYKLDIVDRT